MKELLLFEFADFSQRQGWSVNFDNLSLKYYINASGDFMMMHRKNWNKIKAYPENTYMAVHTDCYAVMMAAVSGLKEKVFFSPVYHQYHSREQRTTDATYQKDFIRLFRQFEDDWQLMIKNNKFFVYNDENWGMSNEQFESDEL